MIEWYKTSEKKPEWKNKDEKILIKVKEDIFVAQHRLESLFYIGFVSKAQLESSGECDLIYVDRVIDIAWVSHWAYINLPDDEKE